MTIDKPRTEFDGNTIIDLLLWRADLDSNSLAYTYLANGHIEDCTLTYQQLKCRVLQVGTQLQAVGAKGDRALLLYPPGLDFIIAFLGCLSAGIIAIPVPAPGRGRLKRTLPRLKAVIDDAEASIALTTSGILETMEGPRSDCRYLNALNWIDTSDRSASVSKEWHATEVSPSTAAYLQYTSGSTSTPKGVIISHENLLQHLHCLQTSCGYTSDSVTVTWMPHFHDYGLVEGMMEPLFNGTPSYLMSPFAFVKRPFFWLKAISRYRATHSQAPNFAYARCVERVSPEDLEILDLSSWVQAANAAEPINPRVMRGFYERFKGCGFHWEAFMPGYGLAENTLAVSMSPVFVPPVFSRFDSKALGKLRVVESAEDDRHGTMVAGCGIPIKDTVVAIVDAETRKRCAADSVGEIWISSSGVASGYWRRPEESERTFRAEIVNEREEGNTYLRSGDLGFMREGELFITGRLKDLIIIGGVNHWPHDIEWTVEQSHPAIRSGNFCAAFSVDADDVERLVVVAETQKSWTDFKEIYNSVTQAISESHDLMLHQLVFVKSGSVPKTSSGKVQRGACRSSLLSGSLPVLWEKSRIQNFEGMRLEQSSSFELVKLSKGHAGLETWLLHEITRLAGLGAHEIDLETPISHLGLDSINTLTLVCQIEDKLEKKLPLAEVIRGGRTVRQLAEILAQTNWSPSSASLVAIHSGGSKPPLFCVHPAGGNVVGYAGLAHHLGPDQPFYGLQAPDLVSGQEPLTLFEDMAKHYLSEIRGLQPEGPYYLSGMCLGGVIAFEMAQQLLAANESVAFLGLIDSRNPPSLLNAISNQAVRHEFDSRLGISERREELCKLKEEAAAHPSSMVPDGIIPDDPILRRVFDNNTKALQHYLPVIYPGPITFFWANRTPGELGFFHNPHVFWSRLAGGGLEIQEMDANHFELLEEPHVLNLAHKMRLCLDRAQSLPT